jgi:hypothetical protein
MGFYPPAVLARSDTPLGQRFSGLVGKHRVMWPWLWIVGTTFVYAIAGPDAGPPFPVSLLDLGMFALAGGVGLSH